MSRPSTTDIVIVGAGPYGLSVAAHFRRHGLPFRIFGSPTRSWQSNMPAGMFLKSEGRASSPSDPAGSYTLKAHCEQYDLSHGDYGVPVPLETFSDYGLKFQQRFVPDVEDTQVLALHRSSHGYELQTATGEMLAAKAWSSPSGSAISGRFRSGWLICPESWSRIHRTMVPLQPASYRLPQALHVVILSWPLLRQGPVRQLQATASSACPTAES